MDEQSINISETEPFHTAKLLAHSFGSYTAAFSAAIRSLTLDSANAVAPNKDNFSSSTKSLVNRLIKCPSVMAPFYYASLTCHEEKLEKLETIKPDDLLELYLPNDLAALFGTIYVCRRLEKICDKEHWQPVAEKLQLYADVALLLGSAVPSIGRDRELVIAACKHFAFAIFSVAGPAILKKYRISLSVNKVPYDLKSELEYWGTTHLHIGAHMLTALGFSSEYASAYLNAGLTDHISKLDRNERCFKAGMFWLESLVLQGTAPQSTLGDEFEFREASADAFLNAVDQIKKNGSPHSWLFRRKEDLGPENAPKLDYDPEHFEKKTRRSKNDSANSSAEKAPESNPDGSDTEESNEQKPASTES